MSVGEESIRCHLNRQSMIDSNQGSQVDFDPGQSLGDRTVLFGRFSLFDERLLIDSRNLGFPTKVY